MKKFRRPSHWLVSCISPLHVERIGSRTNLHRIQGLVTTTWAIVMTLMGVVQSYGGLLAARLALGVAEAGLFPVRCRDATTVR